MSVVVPGSGGQRYVKMFGRSTSCLLAPSEINYSYPMNGEQADLQGLTTEQEDTIAASLLLYRLPKMQVTEKGGRWFALNNASLRLFRRLEYEGKCSKVSAEVVPLSKVPPKVREAMANAPILEGRNGVQASPALMASRLQSRNQIADRSKTKFRDKTGNKGEEDEEEEEETGQTTKKGYHKIGRHLDDEDNDDTASSRNGDDDVTSSSCTEDDDEDSQDLENSGGIVDDDSETDFQDDELTCNVCDRTFSNGRQMARHQQRRRHFWCSVCETLFPALTALERHKQNLDHWSDEEEEGDGEEDEDEDDDDQDEGEGEGAKENSGKATGDGEVTSEDDESASPESTVRRKSGEQERLL